MYRNKHLNHDLQVIKNRACAASPGHKKKWTEPSSNRPIKFVSPDSKAARILKSSKARKRLRRVLSNFADADVNLDNDQNNEMTQLVNQIENKGRNNLERIFEEAEETNKGNKDIVQQVWERDIEERKSFYEDQLSLPAPRNFIPTNLILHASCRKAACYTVYHKTVFDTVLITQQLILC